MVRIRKFADSSDTEQTFEIQLDEGATLNISGLETELGSSITNAANLGTGAQGMGSGDTGSAFSPDVATGDIPVGNVGGGGSQAIPLYIESGGASPQSTRSMSSTELSLAVARVAGVLGIRIDEVDNTLQDFRLLLAMEAGSLTVLSDETHELVRLLRGTY